MSPSPAELVKAYHQRTKHHLQRYAAGPQTLDWDAQPDPFRQWVGSPMTPLPLVADSVAVPWADLGVPGRVAPWPVNRTSVGLLLELSFALTAWKQQGPDRWALRANPSSGNLHPTEVYLLAQGVNGVQDGLHHYAPREHGLALRAASGVRPAVGPALGHQAGDMPSLWVGLSSVQWREAWKYGERAFRYCQLDAGHAVGALRYAAAVLGWQARVVPGVPTADLAALLGLDRAPDFGRAEREEPELLIQVGQALPPHPVMPPAWGEATAWQGQASLLDAHPMYRWPVIDEVAQATRQPAGVVAERPVGSPSATSPPPSPSSSSDSLTALSACTVIRGRRSAQHFDRRATLPADAFFRIAQALMPRAGLPWDAWPCPPRVHVVVYAHRVEGLVPGAYVLPRSEAGRLTMAQALQTGTDWQPVTTAPADLPLQCLAENAALAGALRTLSCHQAIGSDACLAVSLLAEFDDAVDCGAWHYRELLQEAGLIGQVLYLQAEAEGYRGTGIGCYFDDAVHELLGLRDAHLQVLYHFTVGQPVVDPRISTEPPYAHRPTLELPA